MTSIFTYIFCTAFGLIIGSFLSVCIYRIPLGRATGLEEWDDEEDEQAEAEQKSTPNSKHFDKRVTISYPKRSFCPACGAQLRWYHNIPFFSYLLLAGRCSFCKKTISIRYPLVELMSAASAVLSFHLFGLSVTALVIYLFVASLIVISFIDYDYYIIPNVISLPGAFIGLVIATINEFHPLFNPPVVSGLKDALLGILCGAGFLLLISEGYFRLRKKQGLGMGDVKLLAMTGAFFGVPGALYTIFIGSLLGSVIGVLLIIVAGRKASQYIPFGPYLAVANILYIFSGMSLATNILQALTGQP